jgi:hypothetical protein
MASLVKRGSFYSIQHYVGGKLKRVATGTTVLQIAKEKLRQFESAQLRGEGNPSVRHMSGRFAPLSGSEKPCPGRPAGF